MSLKNHLFWSFIRNLGVRLGSVIVFIILARILPPEQLGWFAAALVIINFAEIFSDAGFSDAIAQRKKLTNSLLNTAIFLNISIAFVAFGILFSFSEPIAKLINAEEASNILLIMSFGLLINAIGYSAQSYYRHSLQFKWLAIRSLISMLAGAVVGISMALTGFGIWSFVWQFIVTSILNTILCWVKIPWVPSLQIAKNDAKDLFYFGKNIMLMKILHFTSTRSIEIFIVAIFGPVKLALYIMGSRIYAVAMQLLSAVTIDVMLPSFSKSQDDLKELKKNYHKAFEVTLILISPLFILLSIYSTEIISIIFGDNGTGASQILFSLAILGSILVVSYLNATVITALGKPNIPLIISIVNAIFTVLLMLFFYFVNKASMKLFIDVYVIMNVLTSIISFYYVGKVLSLKFSYYLISFLYFITGISIMWLVNYFSNEIISNSILNLLISGFITLTSYIVFVFVTKPNILINLVKQIRS